MGLFEFMKIVASGEPVELFDVDSKFCASANDYTGIFSNWMEWEVVTFYSVWNESKHETKTHVEVRKVK